jgi:hypothetical protein
MSHPSCVVKKLGQAAVTPHTPTHATHVEMTNVLLSDIPPQALALVRGLST